MNKELLLLGVDGGGTRCRARLCSVAGDTLGEGLSGPANARLAMDESLAAVLDATSQCMARARIAPGDRPIVACIALAGASEPVTLGELQTYKHPFLKAVFTTDSHAACVGAHRGQDGGVIIVGTGSIGEAIVRGKHCRAGGWGFPVSDEGSGAWLGCEAVRRVLWAFDGRIPWTGLLSHVSRHFESDPYTVVRWMGSARPANFGSLAPLVIDYASRNDPVGRELMRMAAGYIDGLAERLRALGAERLALTGGLAASIRPWLGVETKRWLVPAAADALTGAVELARAAAETGTST